MVQAISFLIYYSMKKEFPSPEEDREDIFEVNFTHHDLASLVYQRAWHPQKMSLKNIYRVHKFHISAWLISRKFSATVFKNFVCTDFIFLLISFLSPAFTSLSNINRCSLSNSLDTWPAWRFVSLYICLSMSFWICAYRWITCFSI